VTSSTLLLLLALRGRLWRSASGTGLGKVGIETFGCDRSLRGAVHVLSAKVGSGGVSALVPHSSRGSRHVPALAAIELHPVVLAILDFARVLQRRGEEFAEVVVIGLVLEAQVAHVGEVLVELLRVAIAEVLDGSGLLLLSDLLVLLLVRGSLQALPGKTSTEEVHEHVAKGLEIVTTRLFPTKMGVDTHVSRGTGEGLPLTVRDVLLGLRVTVLLGHAEINNVDNVGGFAVWPSDQEVIRLDIAVDEVLLVDSLHAGQHLLGDHDDSLDREATSAVVEEILERRTEQVNDKNVVEAFLAKVIDIGDASCMVLLVMCQSIVPGVLGRSPHATKTNKIGGVKTYGIRRESCRSCTRPSAAVHRSSEART
jgi:hypothetical protein